MYSAKPKLISKKKSNKKINIYNVPRSLFLPVSIDSFYIQTTSVYSKKIAKQKNSWFINLMPLYLTSAQWVDDPSCPKKRRENGLKPTHIL